MIKLNIQRVILLCFISLSPGAAFAQFFHAKVMDVTRGTGIMNAHAISKGGYIVDVADYAGRLVIDPRWLQQDDSLRITCIGYKPGQLVLTDPDSVYIVALEPDALLLNELFITPLSAQEMIRKSILAIPDNFPEKQLQGSHFLTLNDSLMLDTLRFELMIPPGKQPRLTQLTESSADTLKLLNQEVVQSTFDFDHIVNRRGFMNLDNLDSWQFEIDGYTSYQQQEIVIIKVKYLAVGKMSHSGRVLLNLDDYGIHQIEFGYHWEDNIREPTAVDSIFTKTIDWEGFASYQRTSDGYCLHNLGYTIDMSIEKLKKGHQFDRLAEVEVQSEFTKSQNNGYHQK